MRRVGRCGGYDYAAGLEWWRNAAEQSKVVMRAKNPSATASDIPATARSSASCAPWNNTPSAIVLGSAPLPASLACGGVQRGPLAQACASFIATREEGEWGRGGMEEKRRVTRGAARGGSGGGDTTTWPWTCTRPRHARVSDRDQIQDQRSGGRPALHLAETARGNDRRSPSDQESDGRDHLLVPSTP